MIGPRSCCFVDDSDHASLAILNTKPHLLFFTKSSNLTLILHQIFTTPDKHFRNIFCLPKSIHWV